MKRTIGCALLGFVISVAAQATAGDLRRPLRPFLYLGHDTHVINLVTGEDTYTGYGECSTIGRTEQEATGWVDPQTVLNPPIHLLGAEGTVTTPSGDLIFWTAEDGFIGPNMVLSFEGGTGRFEHVEGELNSWEFTNVQLVVEGPIVTITFQSRATGWIRY